jgi:N-6 DNA Methylase
MATKPEHTETRLPLVDRLVAMGWKLEQLQFEPEWRVPKRPSEASKRELGYKFDSWPVDIAIFDDPLHSGEYEHLLGIVETKAPDLKSGRNQLEIYLANEPYARFAFWANGTDRCLIFRLSDGSFFVEVGKDIPGPAGPFIFGGEKKITWEALQPLTVVELRRILNRLLNAIVAQDATVTRSEEQLNQLCNLILAKLHSDQKGKLKPKSNLEFQTWENAEKTKDRIQKVFADLFISHTDLFDASESKTIKFDAETIHTVAYELGRYRLLDASLDVVSQAFQVFRRANLKSGEGQYYTPYPVIESAVAFMEVDADDKVIDPACGTGGFLLEAFRQIFTSLVPLESIRWAQRHLYGVDKDEINVKLSKALMLITGDGSAHVFRGDSLSAHRWPTKYPQLQTFLGNESYTCVITNPPFGENLKLKGSEAKLAGFTISRKPKRASDPTTTFDANVHEDRELGILFLERSYKLLVSGGRLGIVLPETYFFSSSYRWLQSWLSGKLELIGALNIPMEAFQGFCRAKTNFYVFRKVG